MVWGGVQPDGELQLEPVFVLDAVPTRDVQSGPYRLTGRDGCGRALFSYSLAMGSLDHGGGAAFAHMIPVEPGLAVHVSRGIPAPRDWRR